MTQNFDWQKAAEELWKLLDDIDTGTDIFKPNNNDKFTQYVYKKVAQRFNVLKSDGYKTFPNENFK
jgi:calcineurin-like phosphoesterase family protein